ncbi:hypothetical protein [Mycoplasma parvum]|uniref:hypothetical protein n=1 Tax=Mycoplasma parvum TaxID=984991 RepID=UPI001182C638|nr:hypothetical protein [Mycoplasma parvum]
MLFSKVVLISGLAASAIGVSVGGGFGLKYWLNGQNTKFQNLKLVNSLGKIKGNEHNEDENVNYAEENHISGEYEVLWSLVSIEKGVKICDRKIKQGEESREIKGGCNSWAKNIGNNTSNKREVWLEVKRDMLNEALNELNLQGEGVGEDSASGRWIIREGLLCSGEEIADSDKLLVKCK